MMQRTQGPRATTAALDSARAVLPRANPLVPQAQGVAKPTAVRIRTTLWLLGSVSTVYLSALVIQHRALPISDLGTSALATTTFCLSVTIAVLWVQRMPLLSPAGAFLGVTFLFTNSSLILYRLVGADAFQFWKFVDFNGIRIAMPVVMLAFSSFLVGALLVPPMPQRGAKGDDRLWIRRTLEMPVLRTIGLVAYAASLATVAVFTFTGSALSFAIEGGYGAFSGARKSGDLSQFVVGTLAWFLPWSLLILAATSAEARTRRRTTLLAIPAVAVMFLAGNRGQPLAVLLLISIANLLVTSRRIRWRTLIIVAVVAVLVPTVGNLRKTPVSDWSIDIVMASLANRIEGTPTFGASPHEAILTSMGQSYQTLAGTVLLVPEPQGYRLGGDYARSTVLAVPFANTALARLGISILEGTPSNWLKSIINPDGRAGQGYLQIAEAYLQFGAFGVVGLFLLLGWGTSRLWWNLCTRPPDPRALAFWLIMTLELLLWVRNDAGGVARTAFWAWLLTYAAPAILRPRLRRWNAAAWTMDRGPRRGVSVGS